MGSVRPSIYSHCNSTDQPKYEHNNRIKLQVEAAAVAAIQTISSSPQLTIR